MTYREVAEMVDSIGVPSAYYQFEEGSGQQCPFITFFYGSRNDFKADDTNYVRIAGLTIELYTDEKDFVLEEKVEDVLESKDIPYQKEEVYIDSEKMFEVIYKMEVMLNGKG